jgi:hypothetical protein
VADTESEPLTLWAGATAGATTCVAQIAATRSRAREGGRVRAPHDRNATSALVLIHTSRRHCIVTRHDIARLRIGRHPKG